MILNNKNKIERGNITDDRNIVNKGNLLRKFF